MNKLTTILSSSIFLLIIFLFAFIPLYPKFPFLNVKGTFVAIRIEDLFIALTFALFAIFIIVSGKFKELIKDRLNQSIALFFLIGIISVFSGIFLTHTATPHLSLLHFLRRIEFIMLLPVVATAIQNRKQLVIILVVLALVVIAVNFYALGQQFFSWPVISTTNSEFSKGQILYLTSGARVNSTFAGHYDLGVFLAMVLVIITPLFFAVRKSLKPLILFLGIFSLIVLIMTAARLSFVAAFMGIIIALFLAKKKKYILLIGLATVLIFVYPSQLRDRLLSTVTINLFQQGQRYEGRTEDQRIRSRLNIPTVAVRTSSTSAQTSTFATQSGVATDITPGEPLDTTQLGVYRSFAIRFNIEWPRALLAFYKNPFLGTGYASIDIATDNDFLRSLGEVGILGTLAFGLIIIEAVKRIYKFLKDENRLIKYFSAGVLSMMLAFLINGLFIDVFEASKVASLFWMMLGLNLATLKFR